MTLRTGMAEGLLAEVDRDLAFAPSRLRLAVSALLAAVALATSACGGSSGSSEAELADPEPSASTSETATQAASLPPVGPLEQFVKVSKYGVGFGLPKDWVTVQAKAVEAGGPVLKRNAWRLHISPKLLAALMMQNGLETFSMDAQAAKGGFHDSVSTGAVPGRLATDAQVKQRLTTMGAKFGRLHQSPTPVGEAIGASFYLVQHGALYYGRLLVVDLGADALVITISSDNSGRVGTIEDEVKRTLQRL